LSPHPVEERMRADSVSNSKEDSDNSRGKRD